VDNTSVGHAHTHPEKTERAEHHEQSADEDTVVVVENARCFDELVAEMMQLDRFTIERQHVTHARPVAHHLGLRAQTVRAHVIAHLFCDDHAQVDEQEAMTGYVKALSPHGAVDR
jgi:hypothetical protein